MKKHTAIFKSALLVLLTALVLPALFGCVRADVGVTLRPFASGGEIQYTVDVNEALLEDISDADAARYWAAAGFDPEKLETEKVRIDGADYLRAVRKISCATVRGLERELEKLKWFGDGDAMFAKARISRNFWRVKLTLVSAAVDGRTLKEEGLSVNDVYRLTVTVKMPGRIVSHDGGEVGDDGRTLTWKPSDLEAETTLKVSSGAYGTAETVAFLIVDLAAAATVAAVIAADRGMFKKKKPKQN